MIARRVVWALGLAQLICWGISFYYVGVFGDLIADELGWSRLAVYGGFSAALVTMGAVSPFVGRAIDRFGGRPVLVAGALLCAACLLVLSASTTLGLYYATWIGLGIAMRCTLYDAAFATLVGIEGASARRSITQITLVGGLAATCFWPLGHILAEAYTWRGATLVFAGFGLALVPLFLMLPNSTARAMPERTGPPGSGTPEHGRVKHAALYALIVALGNGLHAGMSAHLIPVLTELGLTGTAAVSIAALRGIGQTTGRAAELTFGQSVHPIDLNTFASGLIVVGFTLGLAATGLYLAAATFVFLYGVAIGLLTITRGTLPLVLFDSRRYGSMVGPLLIPSFLLSAAAPVMFAFLMERSGAYAAIGACAVAGAVMVLASLALPARGMARGRSC